MTSISTKKSWRSDDTMDDDSDEKDIKRKCRNLSEKKRRDQFNLLVNELNSIVTIGGRKLDKSTILKQTICFLKNHSEIKEQSQLHEVKDDWKPSFLTNEEFIHLVLEAADAFIIAFSVSGQILYVSENITSLLGHTPEDFLNTTIFEMIDEEERNNIYGILANNVDKQIKQISFLCSLRKGRTSSEIEDLVEQINITGYLRSDETINQDDDINAKLLFVGIGRLQRPQLIRNISITDSTKSEFSSRHSLEWKFLFLDHRAPPIIGYLPFELLGTSGYDYYHIDDLEDLIRCHKALIQKGESTSCYYRFLTKGQQWIWLQSRFYITYHQWNAKPEFVACTHRVISYADVIKKYKTNKNCEKPIDSSSPIRSRDTLQWGNKNATVNAEVINTQSLSIESSVNTQNPQAIHCKLISIPSQSTPLVEHQFIEPTQYVTTIPIQPIISSYPSPVLLSPISSAELTQEKNIIQADLQRKHAELQASIGQQQAELRAVSEQLLMAKLGFIPSTSNTDAASFSYAGSSTVSSTTHFTDSTITAVMPTVAIVQSIPQSELLTPLIPVESSLETSNVDSLYLMSDFNTTSTLEELK